MTSTFADLGISARLLKALATKHVHEPVPVQAEAIPPRIHIERPAQIGVASWSGDREAGRLTASGDVFDPHRFTAAPDPLELDARMFVFDRHGGSHNG